MIYQLLDKFRGVKINYKSIFNNNKDLIFALALYSLLSVILLNYYQYAVNSDVISYIGIAQKYAMGDWANAINGYWSPLFSWLMMPFLLFGSTPLHALYISKIVSLTIGFFTIIGVRQLSYKLDIDKTFITVILLSIIPLLLFASLIDVTPDLLVTCILIYYLNIIFDPKYQDKWLNGIFCGFLGAMAYLSKSYALPFFLVHFTLFNLIYYFKSFNLGKINISKNFLAGLAIFLILSGSWAVLISEKYGELTIGTSNEYNYDLVGPKSQGHPMNYQGLLKPPNNSAFSAWEDPSYFKLEKWSPLESWEYFKYQLNLIGKNIILLINIIEYFSILSIIIIISSVLVIIKASSKKEPKTKLVYLLATILIYSGGYCFILIEIRYLWLVYILLVINGFFLLKFLLKNEKLNILNINFKNIAMILLVLFFVFNPINGLIQNIDVGKAGYNLSNTLKSDYNIYGNIASDSEWEVTSHVAYYLNAKYYGITKNTTNNNELQEELEKNNINYYFVWNKKDSLQLSDYMEITGGKIDGLKIYSLNN